MKKFLLLTVGAVFASGCAAMITPNGEIYTDLIVPTSTVVVEETVVSPVVSPVVVPSPRPVVVSSPRPVVVPSPRPVVVSNPRPVVVSNPRPVVVSNPRPLRPINARPQRYAKNPGPRSAHGGSSPKGSRPGGAHGAYFR